MMIKKPFFLITTLSLLFSIHILIAQSSDRSISSEGFSAEIRNNGTISSITFKESGNTFLFNKDELEGPSWYFEVDDHVIIPEFKGVKDGKWTYGYDYVECSFEYQKEGGRLVIHATIENLANVPYQPKKIGLRLGIDTYMDHYPDWESRVFPTLLRSERTHFWGYFMSPVGKILTITSPDPIASWSHDYSVSWWEPPYYFYGHRIKSINLDLINQLPLPKRHPQDLYQIMPGEKKIFRIYLDEVNTLDEVNSNVLEITKAPVFDLEKTSIASSEAINFSILSESKPDAWVVSPTGKRFTLTENTIKSQNHSYSFDQTVEEGLYQIYAQANGKLSAASFYVRKNYSWYMKSAMKSVMDYPQKAAPTHCESWYGFYTSFAGGKFFPDNQYLAQANEEFDKIFPIIFDSAKAEPVKDHFRIQNVSTMIGVLVDRFELYGTKDDLEMAVRLADFLIASQVDDGSYRAHGKVHYTSVIYIAKSLMELLDVIDELDIYEENYEKIYSSVKKAMDELERNKTNIQTEGELTFEDGMISCSALQLGAFALMQDDKKERKKYQDVAEFMLGQHKCLEQLVIPDARMRSGSLRFWEAQYDVLMSNNFFNSPHGWSSWTTYATYYLYLLTGEVDYLIRTFNGLDAAMQMIDLESGELKWAFMVNPFIEVVQMRDNIVGATVYNVPGKHYNARESGHTKYIMGEGYVDMVSDWFFANANDNDVHEHFKCLEEVALGKAYVVEMENGEFLTFNCFAEVKDKELIVTPHEEIIQKVHYNLKNTYNLKVQSTSGVSDTNKVKEMGWFTY